MRVRYGLSASEKDILLFKHLPYFHSLDLPVSTLMNFAPGESKHLGHARATQVNIQQADLKSIKKKSK